MRLILAAALLAAGTAVANEDPFLTGPVLQAEIAKNCKDGCITFSREEAAVFMAEFERIVADKQKQAFAAGVAAQRQACASLVSR